MDQLQIVIIGAGAAGLGAAHYLSQKKFTRITILEASDRIGGRVHTVHFGSPPDRVVELGANWIHGGVPANPLYTLAAQGNLYPPNGPELLNRRVGYFYTSDGKLVNKDVGLAAMDAYLKTEEEAAREEAQEGTLGEYMKTRLDKKLKSFDVEHRENVVKIFNSTMYNYLSFHVGDAIDKVSLSGHGSYVEIPGGDVLLPAGGFSAVLRMLTRNFPPQCIRLGSEVTLIEWGPQRSRLTCSDGKDYEADHVIVTVPLGYLKYNHRSLFSPMLPLEKQMAIERLGFGRVGKVFLEYDTPFWARDFGCIRFTWTDDEMAERGHPSNWVKSIFGFDPVLDNPNVLVAWLFGDAVEVMEKMSDCDIAFDCTTLLRRFTGNPLIPEPRRVLHSTWCHQRLTRGTYTYIPTGSNISQITNLASPLPSFDNPSLLFAGEGTHPRYFSTVHGALLSGIDAAKCILKKYKMAHE